MKKIAYFVLAALLWTGCAKDADKELTGSIYGVITDKATGEPIPSAGVQLNPLGLKTVTGSEGQYEFTALEAGKYTLYVTKTGYTDLANYSITVSVSKTAKGDVQIEKLPPALRVTDSSGKDISELDLGESVGVTTANFNVFNDGTATLEWDIVESCEWITEVSKLSGTLQPGKTQGIIITIDRDKISGGNNTTKLYVNSNDGSKEITVKVVGETKVLPTLNTHAATSISSGMATLNGEILTGGTPVYTERGFVYSLASMPTLETTITTLTASVTETVTYSAVVTGLTLEQTYYVRAYAKNSAGTAYSTNEISFTTALTLPKVSTQAGTNKSIGGGSVTLNGVIMESGDPAYTERGFVYGQVHNPTIEDDTKLTATGSGTGVFSRNLTGVEVGKMYYVRAYATNTKGTAYGEEEVLDFNAIRPTVTTQAASEVGATSAILNGTIVNVGDPAYTERGFVYGTSRNPTVDQDTKKVVSGTGSGVFSAYVESLTTGTTYYVRTYATVGADGTSYGEEITVKPETTAYTVLPNYGIMVTNTDVSSQSWDLVAAVCENLVLGGYDDWKLPTRTQWGFIYNERANIPNLQSSSGYLKYAYWTLDEYSYNTAYCINYNGIIYTQNKGNSVSGRCVRSVK